MAIDFLNNINLNNNKILDFVVDHSNTTDATNVTGKLIYDNGTLKYFDGANWQSLGTSSGTMSSWILEDGDGTEVTVSDAKEIKFVEGGGLDINWTDVDNGTDVDPYDLTFTINSAQTGISTIYNAGLIVGRSAIDANISFAQDNSIFFAIDGTDQIELEDGALLPVTDNDIDLGSSTLEFKDLYLDGTANVDSLVIGSSTGITSVDTDISSVSATDDTLASAKAIKAYVDGITPSTVTVSDSITNTNFPVVFHDESNSLLDDTGALTYNPSTGSLSVANLTVTGTQTVNNVNVIETSSGVIFEGSTANDFETTLDVVDPTADRTINLPNDSGTVALVENILAGTNVSISANGAGDTITIASTDTNTTYTAGDGLDLIGTEFSADLKANGGLVIESTELAVDLSASAITGTLAISDGGTGATSASAAFTALKQAATTSATGVVTLSTAVAAEQGSGSGVITAGQLGAQRNVVATIDVSDTNFASNLYAEIEHSFNTADVGVELYDITTEETVYALVERKDKAGTASVDKVTIKFAAAPTNDIRVIISNHKGATSATPVYA
jgi:hypothetical protein